MGGREGLTTAPPAPYIATLRGTNVVAHRVVTVVLSKPRPCIAPLRGTNVMHGNQLEPSIHCFSKGDQCRPLVHCFSKGDQCRPSIHCFSKGGAM